MNKTAFRPFILPLLMIFCTLFYYFGELIDWATWNMIRANFFYSVHDLHRLLFLAPIIYAGYRARVKGALIVTMVAFILFLPRAFFISPYPDPLLRMIIFTLFAGAIGCLVGVIRNQTIKARKLEATIASERDKLLKILDGMADGVMITGPDYIIRFMNANMMNDFGDGVGTACYRHLQKVDAPCEKGCKIPDVIKNRKVRNWKCVFADGRAYAIVAAPYVDTDGTVCQISIFRNVRHPKSA